jgi:hypothetical protein
MEGLRDLSNNWTIDNNDLTAYHLSASSMERQKLTGFLCQSMSFNFNPQPSISYSHFTIHSNKDIGPKDIFAMGSN